ncbi:hypothetical protein D3C80_951370 [compost metagenome]
MITAITNEPPHPLFQGNHRLGQLELGEGISPLELAIIHPRLEQRVVRARKGQLVDDNTGQCRPSHVYPLPETAGSHQHGAPVLHEGLEQPLLVVLPLQEHGAADFPAQHLGHLPHHLMAGAEEKTAPRRLVDEGDHQIGELFPPPEGIGLGQEARHAQPRLFGVVKGAVEDKLGAAGEPQLRLEVIETHIHRQGG